MTKTFVALAVFAILAGALDAHAPMDKGRLGIPLTEVVKPWTGDLDGIAERRMVRVLTTYSKTRYFIDRGTPRGTAYDQGKLLEDALNKKFAAGQGDVVMADLTVTAERQATVDFLDP